MKKEILTDEAIQKDILNFQKEHESHVFDKYSAYFIPLSLISVLLGFIVGIATNATCGVLSGLVAFIAPLCFLIPYWNKMKKSKQEKDALSEKKYTVIKDTLANVQEETIYEPHTSFGRGHSIRRAHFLYFSSMRWRIPFKNYAWSDLYNMSRDGIINTSLVGEEFYIVILHSAEEIAYAYNTKFFEYKGK